MNWFKIIRIAQLIAQPELNNFCDKIERMYELEYKLHGVKNFPFSGVEKRKENIQANLEKQLLKIASQIKRPLLATFKAWLSSHALLSSEKWAEERTSDSIEMEYDFSAMMTNTIFEYNRYSNENSLDFGGGFKEILNTIFKNIDEFPTFKMFVELFDDDYKKNEFDTLSSEGYEEYGNIVGMNFNNEQEAINYINNEMDSWDLFYDYIYDLNSLEKAIQDYGIDERKIIKEINKNLVFPAWLNYWDAMGIRETRELVENAYNMLKNAKDINELITAINHAMNTSHQTGSMIEHLSSQIGEDMREITETFENMTNGTMIPTWDKELKDAGFSVI